MPDLRTVEAFDRETMRQRIKRTIGNARKGADYPAIGNILTPKELEAVADELMRDLWPLLK
jgi:hypothetical protein